MRMENRKYETANGKPVIVDLFSSVFHSRFSISGLRFRTFLGIGERSDTLGKEGGISLTHQRYRAEAIFSGPSRSMPAWTRILAKAASALARPKWRAKPLQCLNCQRTERRRASRPTPSTASNGTMRASGPEDMAGATVPQWGTPLHAGSAQSVRPLLSLSMLSLQN